MPALFLEVQAGEHDRKDCPVDVPIPGGLPTEPLALSDEASGVVLPVQRIGDRLAFVLDGLQRGERRRFRLLSVAANADGVRLDERADSIDVTVDGQAFTTYRFGSSEVRPYFYPLLGPGGTAMTRNFPMVSGIPNESTDHPHHRSLYVAFGEVNGVDVWAEPPHPNTGRIVHAGWDQIGAGVALGELRERLTWTDGVGTPLLEERRRMVAHATKGVRLLDLDIVLKPTRVAVLFGDTKEGGPLAIRMASAIEGARGGLIQNAYGGRREAETWGKRSPWVDYSGTIGNQTLGVAMMDHPSSFRHPTWWHVRDYGLFAANPFGTSAFTGDPTRRGDVILAPGEQLMFRYRVCLHVGDADAANLRERYHDYANPPRAAWA
jgi:hypothetical protein